MSTRIGDDPWPARIAKARKAGEFTADDRRDAKKWQTCACGKLDADIPRFPKNDPYDASAPIDGALYALGLGFYNRVNENDFDRASATIRAITKRAAKVLREQRSKA